MPPHNAWTGQLKHAVSALMSCITSVPETLSARGLLDGLACAVHEESCGVISQGYGSEQRQPNEPRPAPVPHQTTDGTRGDDKRRDNTAFTPAIGQ